MKSRYSNGNIFSDVKVEKFPRHKFNKGFFNKFTCNHGLAVPFFVDDVIPGDKIDINTFGRIQLEPLATSSMQNIRCYFRYFYIPYRLLWPDWDKFITQDPTDETRFKVPHVVDSLPNLYRQMNVPDVGNLPDMLGYNLQSYDNNGDIIPYTTGVLGFNIFRVAAYQLVWDYYFRDENLQAPVFEELRSGQYNGGYFLNKVSLLPVAWEKDYFTTALPWPQVGEPVQLGASFIGGDLDFKLPVKASVNDIDGNFWAYGLSPDDDTTDHLGFSVTQLSQGTTAQERIELSTDGTLSLGELSTSFNINDLRYSNALQRFLERKALGGSRPAEFYLSMYGVRVDDLRIGQPLYLGGGFTNVSVTDVYQSVEEANKPLGSLAGNGKSFPAIGMNKPYYCQEFGVVLGIMYIRPEINYTQGIDKRLQLFDVLDFYNPVFAHLGEEAVRKSELLVYNGLNNYPVHPNYDDPVFGYQSRYAYLKHRRNEIHGEFKNSLSKWVLTNHFTKDVELNDEFIRVAQNYDIFAVDSPSVHHYLVELYNDYQCESSMPDFAIPSL